MLSRERASSGAYVLVATDGETKYILPVSRAPCSEKFRVRVDGEDLCEAEYTQGFLVELLLGRTSLEVVTYEDFSQGKLKYIGPAAEEATNPHVLYALNGKKVLLKGYRLYRENNFEPHFYKYLSPAGIVPRLLAEYKFGEVPLGIVTEYIEGGIDPGFILYNLAKETLGSQATVKVDQDLLVSMGKAVSSFHYAMYLCHEFWCRPSLIDRRDVNLWSERVSYYLKEVAGSIPSSWLDALARQASKCAGSFELLVGTYKIRNHQDLHFSQMIFKPPQAIFLLDFEGEPGRPPLYDTILEPALRDVASLARGASYVSFYAIKDYYSLSLDETVRMFLEEAKPVKLLKEWMNEIIEKILKEYLKLLPREIAAVTSPNEAYQLIYPWLVERALYEAYYEKKYRPRNIAVAISTFLALL